MPHKPKDKTVRERDHIFGAVVGENDKHTRCENHKKDDDVCDHTGVHLFYRDLGNMMLVEYLNAHSRETIIPFPKKLVIASPYNRNTIYFSRDS
jgi:hypothetical protein